MTKALLGNLAAINTVVQLSLPNSHFTEFTSTGLKPSLHTSGKMSNLVAGSVAEQGSFDFHRYDTRCHEHAQRQFMVFWKLADNCDRSSSYRSSNGSYDPFEGRPQNRYSPPRTDFDEPFLQSISSTRPVQMYPNSGPRTSGFPVSAAIPGTDIPYLNHDNLQRTTIVENLSSRRQSQDSFGQRTGSPVSHTYADYGFEIQRHGSDAGRNTQRYHTRRRPLNQDEFDGPSQYLPLPLPQQDAGRAQEMPSLPVHLEMSEQDEVMARANDILSECAFHFVAKYQFPVPLERDKPTVRSASDREWTEWAYLLKRLATKRRIPARVLYDNQIKQLVTTLENSIATRQSINKDRGHVKQKPKDDRYILQHVSAGTQVAKILMDSLAMEQLSDLYARTEAVIFERRRQARHSPVGRV